jgi:hypothetical protein
VRSVDPDFPAEVKLDRPMCARLLLCGNPNADPSISAVRSSRTQRGVYVSTDDPIGPILPG